MTCNKRRLFIKQDIQETELILLQLNLKLNTKYLTKFRSKGKETKAKMTMYIKLK